ncbi:gas vesicle protein [Actinomadura sp. DC4]|uniref:gas vesicle protein n=1 Tax=Actinomadura sp. DC4 TaxID=3055069 RepID=UPI0025B15B69|nr:gas vesicle protein [Actinomadura sp. DC4]MDN3358824.1 gas vesicle protein [Actinomadura sp. DC4]
MTGIGRQPSGVRRPESANLADILERVLDKGIVIAGDIQVNLLDIELLTIKLRLVICSVDRAKEMGIDWWEHDPTLSSRHTDMAEENRLLRDRLAALEGDAEEDEPTPERRAPRSADRPERRERERRERRTRSRPPEEDDDFE